MFVDLMTAEGEHLADSPGETPWTRYPRPQMRRKQWLNLNGMWEFAVGDGTFPALYDRKIRVPFCPESRLSGIATHFREGAALYYRRRIAVPGGFDGGRVLLHIGAADQHLECFVNGRKAGSHSGGYEQITFDITDYLTEGENEICFRCVDNLTDQRWPYGKQTLKRGGMWYTPVSGIWQTVWLEHVPEAYIRELHIENRGASVTLHVEPRLSGTVTVAGLGCFALENGQVTITPEKPRFWSPEDPFLYDFTLEAGADRIESYFAIRTLEIKKIGAYQRLCLNGKPYFFHGLLDQGYWPDGLFTPAAPECYEWDIQAVKKLGFNTLRKHIKVEPEEFYYQCDRLGMIVFQDMVNNGPYHYIRDTALPTLSLTWQKILPDRRLHRNGDHRAAFLAGMEATVNQLKNHPSICCWTIFNEGWGQFDSATVYERLRALDDTRWVDATSGWFRQEKTDVDSRHVYFRTVALKAADKPLVLSEFGGYSCKIEGHSFNPDETYGYGKFRQREEFVKAVQALYRLQVVPCVKKGLCAAIYTQVSDVEDETNGLLTYDRRLEKLTAEEMLPIAAALRDALNETQKEVATSGEMG